MRYCTGHDYNASCWPQRWVRWAGNERYGDGTKGARERCLMPPFVKRGRGVVEEGENSHSVDMQLRYLDQASASTHEEGETKHNECETGIPDAAYTHCDRLVELHFDD